MRHERRNKAASVDAPTPFMRSTHRTILTTALLLHWGVRCFAQSNMDSFSSLSSVSGPPTGYQVAAISYSPIWDVGSPPYVLRILGGDYWTDSAGHAILWPASKPRRSGDKHHRFTRVLVGRVSFSLPLSPAAAGLLGAVVSLVLGFSAVACIKWRGKCENAKPTKL
jgi:hypothetical protein